MKKIYNKNAREKALLEEAYGAIYERRNPDSGEWGGGLKGVFPGAEEGPDFDEEEEKQYRATNVQLMQILHNNIKRYGSEEEAIERLGIDPSLHKDLLRRYKKWAEREASFKDIKPASWFENEEEDDFFAWHDRKKKFLGKRGDIVKDSVTGDKGVIVNVRDYKVDLRNGEREWTAKIKNLVLDEEEEAGDDEIDLTVKDPSKAYEDLEGGEGKYL